MSTHYCAPDGSFVCFHGPPRPWDGTAVKALAHILGQRVPDGAEASQLEWEADRCVSDDWAGVAEGILDIADRMVDTEVDDRWECQALARLHEILDPHVRPNVSATDTEGDA